MLSAIISTRESERSLVPTLNALFPAVMTGLLAEVIIADAGSRDATRDVADIAGCTFLSAEAPLGQRLKAAVAASKSAWLLFLPAGSIPDATWVDAVQAFIAQGRIDRGGVFRTDGRGLSGVFGAFLGGRKPDHGLLIAQARPPADRDTICQCHDPLDELSPPDAKPVSVSYCCCQTAASAGCSMRDPSWTYCHCGPTSTSSSCR